MIIYIDKRDVPDPENISNEVFKFLLSGARRQARRFEGLYDAYLGRNIAQSVSGDEVSVNINYCKYVADIVRNFFLDEPVKYDNNEKATETALFAKSARTKATVRNGNVVEFDGSFKERKIDISPVIAAYEAQGISKTDAKIGKYMGIFGSVQELLYASDDENPMPRSAVILPSHCVLVQDSTIEHRNIFFMVFDKRKKVSTNTEFYAVNVYTDKTETYYESSDLESFMFEKGEKKPHFYGAVPCVNYDNDDERQGDIEQIEPLSRAYSKLMSDRLTDKRKFIDAILALYGFELPNEDDSGQSAASKLRENKLIDGIPTDARIEYIQRVFDENSVKLLGDDLIRDIHKVSMTVDMSDESFSGNITGIALEMKFLPMGMLTKTKIRNFDEGLKNRFELYNHWLNKKGLMPIVSKNDIDVVFTVDMPSNLSETVSIVKDLEGRVDEQTLLSLLPFVKDPAEMVKIVKEQKKENQRGFLDSFGKSNFERDNEEPKKQLEETK